MITKTHNYSWKSEKFFKRLGALPADLRWPPAVMVPPQDPRLCYTTLSTSPNMIKTEVAFLPPLKNPTYVTGSCSRDVKAVSLWNRKLLPNICVAVGYFFLAAPVQSWFLWFEILVSSWLYELLRNRSRKSIVVLKLRSWNFPFL